MNKVILCGRLGKDLETRFTASGAAVANTSLATSKKIKGEEKTSWHNLTFWGKTAELAAQYFKKGDVMMVEGEIDYRTYQNKDGETKYQTDITVTQLHFVPGGTRQAGDSQGQQQERPAQSPPASSGGMDNNQFNPDDDIPFAVLPHWREEI